MIRIALVYKYSEGSRFDLDYYVKHHIAMSRRLLSACGLLSIEVEKRTRALAGGNPM